MFILMFSPCDVFCHMLRRSESCASSVDASECHRHTFTGCSCPRRSSHTRSVRGSCPRRHRRCQRSILLEAQCKWNPSPGAPSLARVSTGAPCEHSEWSINNTSGVCWDVICWPFPAGSILPLIQSSGVILSTHSSNWTEQEDCSQDEVSG